MVSSGVDIRTKLVFALVALALGSMLTLGMFMYWNADARLATLTETQLDALAESRQEAIENLFAGWRDRAQLIASRTQLRLSLRAFNRSRNTAELGRIRRILDDALASVGTVRSLAIFDLDGELLVQVSRGENPYVPELEDRQAPASPGGVAYQGISFAPDGQPRIEFVTDLALEGERIGALMVVLDGEEVTGLTSDYIGLGETGEVMIVMRDTEGIRTLHPVRHPAEGNAGPLKLIGATDPALRALEGDEGVYRDGLSDYRGEAVWAATRFIQETGWGLVVKFDDEEEERSINEFRSQMTTLALSLSAFAILFAVLLGIRFATPMHHLAEVANRIRGGDMGARATVKREDEMGLLARTFNQMADKLEDDMVELYKYRKFFDVSLDLLCIAGTDGYFKRVNRAFERTLGWSTEALLERPFIDLVHPDDVAATVAEIEKLAEGIPTISFVNRFRCADGSYERLRWTSHPEPDGTLYAVARRITDTTEAP